MAWVTTTYVDAFIGQGQRVALFGTAAVFDQFEVGARATVQSVLQYAGYEALGSTLVNGTITEAFLQKLVAAIMVRDAYAMRKGIQLPQAAQATLRLIRRRVNRAAARGDEALLEEGRAAGLVKLVGDGEAA